MNFDLGAKHQTRKHTAVEQGRLNIVAEFRSRCKTPDMKTLDWGSSCMKTGWFCLMPSKCEAIKRSIHSSSCEARATLHWKRVETGEEHPLHFGWPQLNPASLDNWWYVHYKPYEENLLDQSSFDHRISISIDREKISLCHIVQYYYPDQLVS